MNKFLDAQVDKRLLLGYPKVNVDERIIFATLNSVLTYLGMELIGRTNLGEGALDVNVIDYKKIPIVDPQWLEETLKEKGKFNRFLEIVDKMLDMKPLVIENEAKREIRLKMEEFVLQPLGIEKEDILKLYKNMIEIVNMRTERAESIRKG